LGKLSKEEYLELLKIFKIEYDEKYIFQGAYLKLKVGCPKRQVFKL